MTPYGGRADLQSRGQQRGRRWAVVEQGGRHAIAPGAIGHRLMAALVTALQVSAGGDFHNPIVA